MSTSVEITRKFFLKKLPNFVKSKPVYFERYYLYSADGIELRIQRNDYKYELERKTETSTLSRGTVLMDISSDEYLLLKQLSKHKIVRDIYLIPDKDLLVEIKVYKENYEGLIRVEVEFQNEEDANKFIPYDWMGPEITDSSIGKDGSLIQLSDKEFKKILRTELQKI